MRALLVAVNAKYIHSNLGIYSLYAYSIQKGISPEELTYCEFTINQNLEGIIGSIYEEKPDLIGFSCYIWNIEIIKKVSREIRKILPQCMIWFGGPEVSYDGKAVLTSARWVDGILLGEGEVSFYEVLCCYREKGYDGDYERIAGLIVRRGKEIIVTPVRERAVLDEVVFPYQNLEGLENRIIYYESSRGCPYGCTYCLSSVEKEVSFRSMDLVKQELQFFLDKEVPQVKFVDRTFNCNHQHTIDIWRYISEHDNGVTNFHFELSADLLTEEEILLAQKFRPGLAQFEIGVQTTNQKTIDAINRKMDIEVLRSKVMQIREKRNIHQHLDLIVGLPYEDMHSFQKSFCDVYEMKPDQLQVGFLKVLKGSPLQRKAEDYGIVYQSVPPYEVLYTRWISYDEVREIKLVEEMVERYYNSMQFEAAVGYLVRQFPDAFSFYYALGKYFKRHGYFGQQQSRLQNYEILYDFSAAHGFDLGLMKELMVFDLYVRENLKKEPDFLQNREISSERKECLYRFYQKEDIIKKYLPDYGKYTWKQCMRMTHIEWFHYDIPALLAKGVLKEREMVLLFNYAKRNPLSHQAEYIIVSDEIQCMGKLR